MKRILILLSLLASSVNAQTITLGPITKLTYCEGDTLVVPYQASGTFAGDNFFFAQLSDSSGSFSTFTNFGHETTMSGSITVKLNNLGYHFRIRIVASNPYVFSMNNGEDIGVFGYPYARPLSSKGAGYFAHPNFAAGFAQDSITFYDLVTENSNAKFLWQFDQDASPNVFTTSTANVFYPTDGIKSLTLTVTNENGCSNSQALKYRVLSCNPVIPRNVRIVLGTETGTDSVVWVKSGASYSTSEDSFNEGIYQTIFVEQGASLDIEYGSTGVYYIKTGASVKSNNISGLATVVLNRGAKMTFPFDNEVDTFYCSDLQFDYSQVNSDVEPVNEPLLNIRVSPDWLYAQAPDQPILARFYTLLGAEVLSSEGIGELDVDLASLRAGVYVATVEAGQKREVRRIAVVH